MKRLVLLLAALSLAASAQAATIPVTTTAQTGPGCTITAAILAAEADIAVGDCPAGSGADTIVIPAGVYLLTVTPSGATTAFPYITTTIAFEGAGADVTVIARDAAAPPFRLFRSSLSAHVIFRRLTLKGGDAGQDGGGALYSEDSRVTIEDVVFDGNTALVGGAIGDLGYGGEWGAQIAVRNSTFIRNRAMEGGAIRFSNGGSLTAERSRFIDNVALETGGAISTSHSRNPISVVSAIDSEFIGNAASGGGQPGGAIRSERALLTRVLFRRNSARGGGGAVYNYNGPAVIVDSTFEENSAQRGGAVDALGRLDVRGSTFARNDVWQHGGAVYVDDRAGTSTIANSTFSANRAGDRGGAIALTEGTLTIANVTATANGAGYGPGVGLLWNGATVRIGSSIVAGNRTAGGAPVDVQVDEYERLVSLGYNVIGTDHGTRGAFVQAGDQKGTVDQPLDPKLLPLAGNGGPTLTHALAPDSVARDAAGACSGVDQRGVTRPGPGSTLCDSGAYEYEGPRPRYTVTLTVTGGGLVSGLTADGPCGLVCTATVDTGTAFNLAAHVPTGLEFQGWSGACDGASPTCGFTVASDTAVTASFGPVVVPNRQPALTSIVDRQNTDRDVISVRLLASDPDGDPLTFTVTGLPAGLSIDSAGLVTGTPATVEEPARYSVAVQVADGRGGMATATFVWTITHEIPPPAALTIVEQVVVAEAVRPIPSAILQIAEAVLVDDRPALLPAAMLRIAETVLVGDQPRLLPSAILRLDESVVVTDAAAPDLWNTNPGANVMVQVGSGVQVTFTGITRGGATTANPSPDPPAPPNGFEPTVPPTSFDINTTALFSGPITVCLSYPPGTLGPQLMHFESGAWRTRTTSVDYVARIACGAVNSFSSFAVFTPIGLRGQMTGAGELGGERSARFDFRVRERAAGADRGALEVVVTTPRSAVKPARTDTFRATAIDRIAFLDDVAFQPGHKPRPEVDSAFFSGSGTWNGVAGYTFEARAIDRGEPGRGRDAFEVVVRDAAGQIVWTGGGSLSGGNVQSQRLKNQ